MTKNSDSFDYLIQHYTDILLQLDRSEQENRLRMSESNSKDDFERLRIKAEALSSAKIILNTLC